MGDKSPKSKDKNQKQGSKKKGDEKTDRTRKQAAKTPPKG